VIHFATQITATRASRDMMDGEGKEKEMGGTGFHAILRLSWDWRCAAYFWFTFFVSKIHPISTLF